MSTEYVKPRAQLNVYRTVSLRRSQRWAWRLVAENGRIIAISGEGYANKGEALERGAFVSTNGYEVELP